MYIKKTKASKQVRTMKGIKDEIKSGRKKEGLGKEYRERGGMKGGKTEHLTCGDRYTKLSIPQAYYGKIFFVGQ